MDTFVNLFVLKNSTKSSKVSPRRTRRQITIWHPSCSITSRKEPYYEWHRSTETSLDYAITFDIRPDSGLTTKSSRASRFSVAHVALRENGTARDRVQGRVSGLSHISRRNVNRT